jgi:hypothetical protein
MKPFLLEGFFVTMDCLVAIGQVMDIVSQSFTPMYTNHRLTGCFRLRTHLYNLVTFIPGCSRWQTAKLIYRFCRRAEALLNFIQSLYYELNYLS